MRDTVKAEFRMRWWLRWYLAAVISTSKFTGMQPDWNRVEYWIRRGMVLTAMRAN